MVEVLVVDVALLPLDVAVFFQNLGGLAHAGLLLVDGLGDQDARVIRAVGLLERRIVSEDVDKLFIAAPGAVKEDVVTEAAELLQDKLGVIEDAVVGFQLQNRQAERPVSLGAAWVDLGDFLADQVFIKTGGGQRPDQAVSVPVSRQVDRLGPGHDQGAVVDGLVVVAVKKDQVAFI